MSVFSGVVLSGFASLPPTFSPCFEQNLTPALRPCSEPPGCLISRCSFPLNVWFHFTAALHVLCSSRTYCRLVADSSQFLSRRVHPLATGMQWELSLGLHQNLLRGSRRVVWNSGVVQRETTPRVFDDMALKWKKVFCRC